MLRHSKNILFPLILVFTLGTWISLAKPHTEIYFPFEEEIAPEDTLPTKKRRKSTQPDPTPEDRRGDPLANPGTQSPFELKDPDVVQKEVEIDPSLDHYTVNEKVGNLDYRAPSEMTFEEFYKMKNQEMMKNYWKNKNSSTNPQGANKTQGPFSLKIPVRGLEGPFGSNFVDIRPTGLVTLDFGGKWQRVYNPALTIRQQKNGVFDFDQQITMNVVGKIGEKLKITANWDTKAAFEFQNNVKVQYTAFEEDIIQGIEVGRVSMPLNSSLINGAQNLFGIKTKLKFGRMTVTSVLARQDGKVDEMVIQGGTQGRTFEIKGHNYEDYRHFFLGQFFRENYERSLQHLPVINSGVKVTRMEVYVTNRNNSTTDTKNFIAYLDLGEGRPHNSAVIANPTSDPKPALPKPPENKLNDIFITAQKPGARNATTAPTAIGPDYVEGTDYAIINSARQLEVGKDFDFHPQLGYLSLRTPLRTDEVLAVSYEYSYNGKTYKVGELQEEYSKLDLKTESIVLKMLKPFTIKLDLPTWDLMMKNIYNLGATQLTKDNFQMRIIYKDDLSGADLPNLQEGSKTKGVPLIQLSGLDKLNPNNDPSPDGNFDYVENATVDSRNGRIVFPVLEPFGSNLDSQFTPTEGDLKSKYVFSELYRSTKQFAEQQASHNKYYLRGRYQASSSSEIILPGINIAPGSVVVIVGSNQLKEGTDYTIDYTLGRLKITNEGALSSGQEIRIRFEKQDLFNFRRKSFYGARFDYQVNKDFIIGGTILQQNEAPQISRVNIGDEPSKNTVWGVDVSYNSESRRLTKLVDKLPFIDTKAPSSVTAQGEFAQLLPGHNKKINQDGAKGIAFIDDFEGSKTPYDISKTPIKWKLATTPKGFAESASSSHYEFGKNRAKLAWYNADNVFYRNGGVATGYDPIASAKNIFENAVYPFQIFPGQDRQAVNVNLSTFDLAYFPEERGPYNYNKALTSNGKLPSPNKSWAGVTRNITNDIDFDNANIQYIEFWMLNPYYVNGSLEASIEGVPFNTANTGKLYFNLGEVSEDVMKDGKRAFENGIVEGETEINEWGKVTTKTFLTNAFSSNASERSKQDVGLDGGNNAEETNLFQAYLSGLTNPAALAFVQNDPSADDFKYYLGDDQNGKTIIERYKHYNGLENNSPTNTGGSFTPSNSSLPDDEDVNQDNTLNSLEEYYEYEVSIDQNLLITGQNFIVNKAKVFVKDNAGEEEWIQFRIPVRSPTSTVGNIQGFKSIRFLRMYMTGFTSPIVLRTANMQLVANQWRAYQSDDINQSGVGAATEPDDALIDVSTVNVEENGQGDNNTSPYVVPPNFIRDQDITSTVNRRLNEQALRLCVTDLDDRNARAVYKNVSYDFLNYGRVNMFIHAESNDVTLTDTKAHAFLRLGTDFKDNYYEIEVPLYLTNPKNTFDPYAIWRGENEINLAIEELINTKLERDRSGIAQTSSYSRMFEGKILTVVGKPDISAVLTIMIGLKNPGDDNLSHSFCIWANELRVTDFNEKTGWAATGKVNLKLADFGNVTGTARYIGAGFGSLEQKVSQRQRNNTLEWGVAGNFSMDKFLPKKLGLKLPMYVGYNRKIITPRYDPLNPDVLLTKQLDNLSDQSTRNDYKSLVVDQTTSRAINFTNIQKVKTKTGGKNHFYDVENLSLSIGYNDSKRTSFEIKEYFIKQYKGGIGYNYTSNPKSYEPFKDSKIFNSKYSKLVKDFNFTLMPNMFTFRTDFDRKVTKSEYYNSGPLSGTQPALYEKYFTISRDYGTTWSLTKNLTATYKARSNNIVDEPFGAPGGKEYNNVMFKNMFAHGFGRLKYYEQNTDINYKLPLDKIPFTDFLNTEYRYNAGYKWTSGPLGIKDSLGNILQNTRDQTVNGKIDLNKLYNKNKFLKGINTPQPKRLNKQPEPTDTVKAPKENKVLKAALKTVMLVKSLNVTYNVAEGTDIYGYMNKPSIFGIDDASNTGTLLPFVMGSQNPNIRFEAANKGWISRSRALNSPFTQFRNQTINVRTTLEPSQDLRIQLDAMVKKGTLFQELFRIDTLGENYVSDNPLRSGSHSISTITALTAFKGKDGGSSDPNSSSTYSTFRDNRQIIAARIGASNLNSQDVLIPAFLAAYKGESASSINLTATPKIPLPNWRIDFTGLGKIPVLKKNFQSITLSHGYSSVYSVGSYTSSLVYNSNYIKPGVDFLSNTPPGNLTNSNGDVIPVYIINEVNIRESFSPLVGLNIRTKGKWTYRAEYRRSRNLSLSLTNAQTRDETSQDFVIGVGYLKTGVKIPKLFTRGKTKTLKNELNMRIDFTLRDTKGVQRSFDQSSTLTAGNVNWQIKPTITYNLSSRVTLQLYFERTSQTPKISSSFKRTTTAVGLQLRFTLS